MFAQNQKKYALDSKVYHFYGWIDAVFYHLLCVLLYNISKRIANDCQSLWNVKQKLFMCVENAKNNHFKNKTSKTIDFYDGAASIISVFCYFQEPNRAVNSKIVMR